MPIRFELFAKFTNNILFWIRSGAGLIQEEAFLHAGYRQLLLEDCLRRILRQFQVVNAGVNTRVAEVTAVLAHNSQARMQVRQAARWQ